MAASVPFCSPHDPTQQYAQLWQSKETQAQLDLADEWMPGMAGRAAQTKPRRVTGNQAPLKQGRAGDIQPAFFGFSAVYAKQFKQLRRLQNFCRWVDQRPQTGIVVTACMALDFGIPSLGPLDLALLSLSGGTRATTAVLLTLLKSPSFVPAPARLDRFLMRCLLKSVCWSKG